MSEPRDDRPSEPSSSARGAEEYAEAELALRIKRIRTLSDELRRARDELRATSAEAKRVRRELRDLRARRSVRLAVGISRRVGGLRRSLGVYRSSSRDASTHPVVTSVAPKRPVGTAARAELLSRVASAPGSSPLLFGTVGVGPDVGRALAVSGRAVVQWPPGLGPAPDVILIADPAFDSRVVSSTATRVAWLDADAPDWIGRPWSDDYDLVLVGDEAAATTIRDATVHTPVVAGSLADADMAERLAGALTAWAATPHLDVAIEPPGWDVAPTWGDYHFGRALQRALITAGYPTRLRLRSEWDAPGAERADAVIHLFGRTERRIRPGQLGILWIISHPDLVSDSYVVAHDAAFAASDTFASALTDRTGRTVRPLHQATDPRRFRPVEGGPPHELLFVANSRGVHRPVVDELTPTTRDLAIYGSNWTDDLVDLDYVRGTFIPNGLLPAYYHAAAIVLNDHWADMAAHGFLSNRLYDAAASGAFVISDSVPGLDDEFDGGIPTFADGQDLRRLVERYLRDPAARRAHADRALARVRERHTMSHRAAHIIAAVSAGRADGESGPPA